MAGLVDVSIRRLEPEIMDQPGLEAHRHVHALRGLYRINLLSRTAPALWFPIRRMARRHSGAVLRVLDVASGGGDAALGIALRARRSGIPLVVHGCDRSRTAVGYASERAGRQCADAEFFEHDVIEGGVPSGYDIILSSLFMHHLEDGVAREFLRESAEKARRMTLVSDLIRTSAGFLLAHLGCRVLSRSKMVHTDGPRSVAAAFTMPEVRHLAFAAGLEGYDLRRTWPLRFLLAWSRP